VGHEGEGVAERLADTIASHSTPAQPRILRLTCASRASHATNFASILPRSPNKKWPRLAASRRDQERTSRTLDPGASFVEVAWRPLSAAPSAPRNEGGVDVSASPTTPHHYLRSIVILVVCVRGAFVHERAPRNNRRSACDPQVVPPRIHALLLEFVGFVCFHGATPHHRHVQRTVTARRFRASRQSQWPCLLFLFLCQLFPSQGVGMPYEWLVHIGYCSERHKCCADTKANL